MHSRSLYVLATGIIAIAFGCSSPGDHPASTAGPSPATTDAAADGSTLKVTAPTPVSPANGSMLQDPGGGLASDATLKIQAAAGVYAPISSPTYRYQLMDGAGVLIKAQTGTALTSQFYTLEYDKTYKWRVRAEVGALFGPWSDTWSFKTPAIPSGYINGTEVYDPLTDGKSVGIVRGPATFIPGVGLRFDSITTYVYYPLVGTLPAGQFSLLTTNLKSLKGESNKSKLFTMCEGEENCNGELADNDHRLTVEKRGTGEVAWRIITSNDQKDTEGAERVYIQLNADQTYFWKAVWGGSMTVSINQGGPNGPMLYNFGKFYSGVYDPSPHAAFLGAPPHRSGPENQSVIDVIYRGVWISSKPRPAFADR